MPQVHPQKRPMPRARPQNHPVPRPTVRMREPQEQAPVRRSEKRAPRWMQAMKRAPETGRSPVSPRAILHEHQRETQGAP